MLDANQIAHALWLIDYEQMHRGPQELLLSIRSVQTYLEHVKSFHAKFLSPLEKHFDVLTFFHVLHCL